MQLTRVVLFYTALLVGTSYAAPFSFSNLLKHNSTGSTGSVVPDVECRNIKPGHIAMFNKKVCTGPLRARALPEEEILPRLFGFGKSKAKPGTPAFDAKLKQKILEYQDEKAKKIEKAEKEMSDKLDKLLKKDGKARLTVDCADCPSASKDKIVSTINDAWKSSGYKIYEKCRIKDVVSGPTSVNGSAYFYNGLSYSSGTRATFTL